MSNEAASRISNPEKIYVIQLSLKSEGYEVFDIAFKTVRLAEECARDLVMNNNHIYSGWHEVIEVTIKP